MIFKIASSVTMPPFYKKNTVNEAIKCLKLFIPDICIYVWEGDHYFKLIRNHAQGLILETEHMR